VPKPVSGTREWATSSVNVIDGCAHDCRYCYARATAARFGKNPADWSKEVPRPHKGVGKRVGTVMFPSSHDITPENSGDTLPKLLWLLVAGNDVLVVSKPHLSIVETICKGLVAYQDKILFRFTIGSQDDAVLKLWEPGAPCFQERFDSLQHAWRSGFRTSVSMEPLLDTNEDDIVELVHLLEPWVTDSVWLGKMNSAVARLVLNGFSDDPVLMSAAKVLVASQSDRRIRALYERLKGCPSVKWKESIKKVVGIDVPAEPGLDV